MSNTTPERTLELEQQIWKLRIQCRTQDQIAEELGIRQEVVSRLLKRVRARMAKAFEQEIADLCAEQTEQLLYIAGTAIAAWKECRKEAAPPLAHEAETAQPGQPAPDEADEEPSPRKRPNGVAYLKVALQAIAAIRSLWGIERATRADLSPPTYELKEYIGVDMDRIRGKYREEADPS